MQTYILNELAGEVGVDKQKTPTHTHTLKFYFKHFIFHKCGNQNSSSSIYFYIFFIFFTYPPTTITTMPPFPREEVECVGCRGNLMIIHHNQVANMPISAGRSLTLYSLTETLTVAIPLSDMTPPPHTHSHTHTSLALVKCM